MSSETVTVYIAGVLPGHKSFDAPIVAEARAHRTPKYWIVRDSDESFDALVGHRSWVVHADLSTSRVAAAARYYALCNTEVNAAAVALTAAQQVRDAARALLDFETANPQ